MANGFGSKPFNAPMLPDFSAGMPTVAPAAQALPEVQVKSPIDTLKEVFFDIRDGIETLVDQSKEALGIQKEADREQDISQSLSPDAPKAEGDKKGILDSLREQFESLKDAFGNVTLGEKLKAALLVGALALFVKVSDSLVPVVTKIITVFKKVRDAIFGKEDDDATKKTLFGLFAGLLAIKFGPMVIAAAK